jgi:hypothetical protein
MPRDEADQAPIYACPHCDETLACTTPDEQLQISLHRALHVQDRSERLEYKRLIADSLEPTKRVV